MKRFSVFSVLVLICFAGIANAGLNDENLPQFLQGFGFAAGHYSGVGMSYKLVYEGKYAAQVAVGFYSDPEWNDRWAMPGLELQYFLSREERTAFYISTGISYEYYRSEWTPYRWEEDSSGDWYYIEEDPIVDIEKIWTTGFGFGFELLFFDRISYTMESILYYRSNNRGSIMLQGALHYYFNMPNGLK